MNIGKQVKKIASLVGRHRWGSNKPRLLILGYHRILPESDDRYRFEQPPMVVTPDTLSNNLTWISEHFKFIRLSDWLEKCKTGEIKSGKYCAITFDDGWIDNLQYAFPVLQQHNVPATIYCVSSMLREGSADYWPGLITRLLIEISNSNELTQYLQSETLEWLVKACQHENICWNNPSTKDINRIIESLKIYSDADIRQFIVNTRNDFKMDYMDSRQVLSVGELKTMLSSGLIDIGSHTNNHTRLSDDTHENILQDEIKSSKEKIEKALNTDVKTFCYPNGYHPKKATQLTRDAYLGSCTLEKGWNNCCSGFEVLRRVGIHESVASNKKIFKAMLTGWF